MYRDFLAGIAGAFVARTQVRRHQELFHACAQAHLHLAGLDPVARAADCQDELDTLVKGGRVGDDP